MLILHLKKRKMLSKKGCPDTCGLVHPTTTTR